MNNLYKKTVELRSEKGKSRPANIKKCKQEFIKTIGNDLNMPMALGLTWKMLKDKNLSAKEKYELLIDFDKVFGFNLKEAKPQAVPKKIIDLAKQRENFRKEKQWQSADQIRRELEKLGWQVEDTDKGPKLLKS